MRRGTLIAAALLALALGVRLCAIGSESLWLDETYSVAFSHGGVAEILRHNALDSHPSLYYLGLAAWRELWGDGPVRFRLYSVVWSLLSLVALGLWARDAGGERAALLALLFGALNGLHVYYAQEARMYAQVVALTTTGCWLLARWLEAPPAAPRRALVASYAALAAAAIHTHYLAAVLLVAQGLFAGAQFLRARRGRDLALYAGVAAFVAALFAPWHAYVVSLRGALYNAERLDWIPAPAATEMFSFLWRDFFGKDQGRLPVLGESGVLLPAVLACLVLAGGAALLSRAQPPRLRRAAAFALWMLFVPGALTFALGLVWHPLLNRHRFAVLVVTPFLLLAALVCAQPTRPRARRALALALAAGMALFAGVQAVTQQRRDWRQVAAAWPHDARPARALVLPVPYLVPLAYYVGGDFAAADAANLAQLAADLPALRGAEIWLVDASETPGRIEEHLAPQQHWLLRLGPRRRLELPQGVAIEAIEVAEPRAP